MPEVLCASRSGFHGWGRWPSSDWDLSDAWLIEKIKAVHENTRDIYGSRRVQAELRLGHGIQISRGRVQQLMGALITGLEA